MIYIVHKRLPNLHTRIIINKVDSSSFLSILSKKKLYDHIVDLWLTIQNVKKSKNFQ